MRIPFLPMKILRTPDERFASLPDFPYEPRYVEVDALRIAYVEAGPADAAPVLLMHGEPSWSFLYRKMIPILVQAGHRVIAPDLVGFGRSDKPSERADYTYERHVEWMRRAMLESLDLRDIHLVCQDWGGLIGLRLVAEHPDRFASVVTANTALPTGDQKPPPAFFQWRELSQSMPVFGASAVLQFGTITELSAEVLAAYDAPFPDETYKEGARIFPMLVPASPDDPAAPANRAAWESLRKWDKPFLTAFSDKDPIMRGSDAVFQKLIPGCKGQPHTTIEGGGHFLQEDCGEALANVVVKFLAGI